MIYIEDEHGALSGRKVAHACGILSEIYAFCRIPCYWLQLPSSNEKQQNHAGASTILIHNPNQFKTNLKSMYLDLLHNILLYL